MANKNSERKPPKPEQVKNAECKPGIAQKCVKQQLGSNGLRGN